MINEESECLFQKGLAYYGFVESELEEDQEEGFKNILSAAKKEHPEAQYSLGLIYSDDGIFYPETDMEKSNFWHSKAASNNQPKSMTELGIAYLQNGGEATDVAQAENLLSQARQLGDPKGTNALGILFKLKKKDFKLALQYFEEAAEMGYNMANVNLARLYINGHGVEIDIAAATELAMKCINEISDSYYAAFDVLELLSTDPYNNGVAKNAIGERAIRSAKYNLTRLITGTFSPPEGDSELWENIFPIERITNNLTEQNRIFSKGDADEFNKSIQEAVGFFQGAINKGVGQSYYNLGMMFCTDLLGEDKLKDSKYYLSIAAEKGVIEAVLQLAILEDASNPQSKEAFDLFLICAENGMALGQYEIGRRYDFGHGISPNHKLAAIWYKKAIVSSVNPSGKAGVLSSFNLGLLYSEGLGVTESLEEAYLRVGFALSMTELDSQLDPEVISHISNTFSKISSALTKEQIRKLDSTKKNYNKFID